MSASIAKEMKRREKGRCVWLNGNLVMHEQGERVRYEVGTLGKGDFGNRGL